jgi:hypothetical protein
MNRPRASVTRIRAAVHGRIRFTWRRATAAVIDWTLCLLAYLIVSIPLGWDR